MARGFAVGAAGLVAALSVLGGCSAIGGKSTSCPTVGVVDNAGQLTRFRSGEQRDLTDIEFEVQVASLSADCSFDSETRLGSVELDIAFRAQRGPASMTAAHSFGYFVAIVDPDGSVTARKAFSMQAAFEDGKTEAVRTEPLALTIPTAEGTAFPAYRIYVGMQLTREQFDRNLTGGR